MTSAVFVPLPCTHPGPYSHQSLGPQPRSHARQASLPPPPPGNGHQGRPSEFRLGVGAFGGGHGREAGPAAVLETCLPQNSQIFKNNSGGFCLAFALNDFFFFPFAENSSSREGRPELAAEQSRVERVGAGGWCGQSHVQGGRGSAQAPRPCPAWLCGPGSRAQAGDRWGEPIACFPSLQPRPGPLCDSQMTGWTHGQKAGVFLEAQPACRAWGRNFPRCPCSA